MTIMKKILISLLAFAASAHSAFAEDPQLSTRVVVLIDGSGSYSARQANAIERAVSLLDGIAARTTEKRRIHRWAKAPPPPDDRIAIISLDALPGVLWTGSFDELKAANRSDWTKRFKSRSDFASCTDVAAGFNLAGRYLDGDPRFTDKYLLAFTDLVDEPPTTSIKSCHSNGHPSLPPADFPWDRLKDVSVTVLWVPAEQVLAWRRAVTKQGLEANFNLFTDSESAEVAIAPPAKPQRPALEVERAATAEAERLGSVNK